MGSGNISKETKLVDGLFTPTEARDILSSIIDAQINFYKLQYLSQWVGDHTTSGDYSERQIDELEKKKNELKKILDTAAKEDLEVALQGVFELKLLKKKQA